MMHPFMPPAPAPMPSPIAAFPSDPLYAAYLQHHTMLLHHHMEFLTSSLAQVKLLIGQHAEMVRKFEKGAPASSESVPVSPSSSTDDDVAPRPRDHTIPNVNETKEDDQPHTTNKNQPTLMQRKPHSTTQSTDG